MKLYDVPRKSYVKIIDDNIKLPVDNFLKKEYSIVFFDHLDGMYSYCNDVENNIIHLAAWTEVEITSETEFKYQGESKLLKK